TIQGGFSDAGSDMRSRNEGGIAQQRNTASHDPRRVQIEDRLEKRSRRRFRQRNVLWRQNRTHLRPERGYHFRSDQRRGNSAVVAAAPGPRAGGGPQPPTPPAEH